METRQYCTFYLGKRFFGIDVLDVQEVLLGQVATKVPGAGREICGLINLRGQIVTAIDLRERLGFAGGTSEGGSGYNIIVRCEGGFSSFLVDEIGDVIEVEVGSMHPLPESLPSQAREACRGVVQLANQLMIVLDTVAASETLANARN